LLDHLPDVGALLDGALASTEKVGEGGLAAEASDDALGG
jgi:hypothetical protein